LAHCGTSGTAALGQQLTKARAQLDAARADNVALVERLKYVQGFAGSRRPGEAPLGFPVKERGLLGDACV
jgi:hypothetical protein